MIAELKLIKAGYTYHSTEYTVRVKARFAGQDYKTIRVSDVMVAVYVR